MARVAQRDWSIDVPGWAQTLGVSKEAIEIYASSDVIDLHVDTFIWTRVFGYDLRRRHSLGLFGRHFYGHTDFPRILEAGLTGATWIITTNPFKPPRMRRNAFFENLEHIKAIFAEVPEQFALVRSRAEYDAARAAGKHGAFLGIQGGNCLSYDLADLDRIPGVGPTCDILRVTVVHLTSSTLGETNSPSGRYLHPRVAGLTDLGREYVRRLNEKKIFVDLAHIGRRAFFDAVAVHDKSQPLMVTHTGISGVYDVWRNINDEQIKAVADTGGTVGIMFHTEFLGPRRHVSTETIVDHIEHVITVAGEDFVSIGTDYDGAISPPPELPTLFEMPKVVQVMLDRGHSAERIQKVLGGNFLRVVEALRG